MEGHNFTKQKKEKKKGKRSVFLMAFFLFLIGFLFLAGLTIFGVTRIVGGLSDSEDAITRITGNFWAEEYDQMKAEIPNVRTGLERANSGMVYVGWLKAVPWFGEQIKGVDLGLDIAIEMTYVSEDGVAILIDILDTWDLESGFNSLSTEDRKQLLQKLKFSLPDIQRMATRTKIIDDKLQELRELELHPVFQSAVEIYGTAFSSYSQTIELYMPIAAGIDELTGLDGGSQWLVLYLDDEKYRPAGGVINQTGLVFMKDGQVENVAFQNEFIDDTYWLPDFPLVAEAAADNVKLYASRSGVPKPKIDAVIGVTPSFMTEIANIFGQTIESIDFSSPLETAQISQRLLESIFSLEIDNFFKLEQVIRDAIQNKTLVLYSFDEKIQVAYDDAGWSGRVKSELDDLIMIADANIGEMPDRFVAKNYTYKIVPSEDGYLAMLSIQYQNTGGAPWKGVTHILLPVGVEMVSGPEGYFIESLENYSHSAFTHTVPSGSNTLIELSYELPQVTIDAINSGIYQLEMFKQIGASNMILTLDLDFGKKVRAAEPVENEDQFGDTKYYLNTILSQDTVFTVEL